MKILKTCTLLDVRYKSEKYLALDFDQLEPNVKHILEVQNERSQPQPQPQRDVPTTEGMEHMNSSIFNNDSSNDASMFDFDDDSIEKNQVVEIDSLKSEIMYYKRIKMSKQDKENCNVLQWRKVHKTSFPCLFTADQSFLHIPAISIPNLLPFSISHVCFGLLHC